MPLPALSPGGRREVRNDLMFELCQAQGRRSTRVDWEMSVAEPLVDVLVAYLTAPVVAHAATLEADPAAKEHLRQTLWHQFGAGSPMPDYVSADAVAAATAAVAQLLASAGPSDEDAAAWAPHLVSRCGPLVAAFLLGAALADAEAPA